MEGIVEAAIVGMIVGGVDFIMLLSDWFLERRESLFRQRKLKATQKVMLQRKLKTVMQLRIPQILHQIFKFFIEVLKKSPNE